VAVAANVTMVRPTSTGQIQLTPAGNPALVAGTVYAAAGRVRANNAVLALGPGGQITAQADLSAAGTVDLLVDVTGYFR
jgi:hypothetical protein